VAGRDQSARQRRAMFPVGGSLPDSRYRNPFAIIQKMPWNDLNEEEREELLWLLRQAIDGDRYPLFPRVWLWTRMLAKPDPASVERAATPYPPPRPSGEPSRLYRKLRGGGRRR
jgi:hypothetical protein